MENVHKAYMKFFLAKILPLILSIVALIAGFLILLSQTNQNKPILILGGFIFLGARGRPPS